MDGKQEMFETSESPAAKKCKLDEGETLPESEQIESTSSPSPAPDRPEAPPPTPKPCPLSKRKSSEYDNAEPNGFERGLWPERILGITNTGAMLCFLIKWQDTNTASMVPARLVNEKVPQLVIKFYEERMQMENPPSRSRAGAEGVVTID